MKSMACAASYNTMWTMGGGGREKIQDSCCVQKPGTQCHQFLKLSLGFHQRPLEFLVIVMFTGLAFALYVLPNEVWKTGREWKNVPICWEGSKLLLLNSHNTCRISGIRKELKIMKKKSTYKSQWGLVGYGLLRQWLPSFALWMGPNEFCAGLSAWNAWFNWLFQFLSKKKNGSDCNQL